MKIMADGKISTVLNMTIWKVIEWIRSSLSKKIILVFSTVAALLVSSLIYVSYYQTTRLLKEDFVYGSKKNLKLAVKNFESYMDSINEISILLSRDPQFMRDLSVQDDSFVAETYRHNQLRNLFYSRKDIEKISFHLSSNSKEYFITRSSGQVDTFFNDKLVQQEWYHRLNEEKVKNRYLEPEDEIVESELAGVASRIFLSYHRKFINIQNKASFGVLNIYLNYDELNKILDDQNSRYNEVLGIYDNKNNLIYVSDQKRRPLVLDKAVLKNSDAEGRDGDFLVDLNHEEYIEIYCVSENEGWKIIKLIPVKPINETVQRSSGLSVFIGISFICLFFIITIIMSSTITRPLRKLTQKMKVVSTGDFKSPIEKAYGNDEIAHLSNTFNKMLMDINRLIEEKYKAKLGERNARLKSLESQINPHFMYNTLQAISTEALEQNVSNVSTMIEALAKILRYCFSDAEKVTLLTEMEYVKRYFLLIKARFGTRLEIKIYLEQGTENIEIPKLSIQTVVENAIKHAFEKTSDQMIISIEIHRVNEMIEIRISDNGPGIDKGRLEEILKGFEEEMKHDKEEIHLGIGLKNLYGRLKLMYGEKASLNIESGENQGTCVSIVIPAPEDMEENRDA